MDFRFIGVSKNLQTVVVLGAGATRGASFASGSVTSKPDHLPPVDADYFKLLQRLPGTPYIRGLLNFCREEYGPTLDVSMERFYTEAEASDQFHQTVWSTPGPRLRRFGRSLDWFLRSMPGVFAQTIGSQTCDYHETVVQSVSRTDSIISYNYDCLIDAALRDRGGNSWRADTGYGFEVGAGARHWETHGRGRVAERGIQLLKPHGSLNWEIRGGSVRLVKSPYSIATADGNIVPPSRNKNIGSAPFVDVWRAARKAVAAAKALVFVGYSMPEQDMMSHILLRTEARAGGELQVLVIVNPDPDVRARILTTLAPAIGPRTRVALWRTLGGFASNLDRGGTPADAWEPEI